MNMRATGLRVPDLHEETAYGAASDHGAGPLASDLKTASSPHGPNTALRPRLAVKRGLDIAVSLTALVTLLPLMLMVALLIRLDSPGPALVTQVRWGKDRRRIGVYEFRSTRTGLADATGVAKTVGGDPHVSRIGSIIRKTNIDELPQLLNVLKGEMSLVGPGCHAIAMLAAGIPYEELVSDYHRRHLVKPGMTGLAQLRGLRGPADSPGKARARIVCDLHYIDNFSLLLDLRIIFGTILAEVRGGKAC